MRKTEKKRILFFTAMLLVGAAGIIIYLALLGNTPQVFTDVVKEYVALNGENKSIERDLFYIFSLAGCAVYGVFFYLTKKREGAAEPESAGGYADSGSENAIKADVSDPYAKYVLTALIISNVSYALIYSKTSLIFLGALLIAVFLFIKERAHTLKAVILYFMSVYSVVAIYRLSILFGVSNSLGEIIIVPIAFIITLCATFAETFDAKKRLTNVVDRAILVEQVIIPFALLVYFASAYEYKGEIMSVMIPVKDQIIIFILMATFIGEAMLRLKDRWKEPGSFTNMLTYGACVTIMAFNRFSGTGSIISSDVHHPYEDIIGYFQVFELHRKLFTEYIPVSGMYSIFTGFLFKVFGNGQMGYFNLYQNMFGLIIVMLIVLLLKKQLDGKIVFFMALYLSVIDYNRVAFIIPAVLLLFMPKLIEKKNLWLNCWFMISFLYGLYYPLFGAAICLGFAPLGIWQMITYARSGKLKEDMKKPLFWLSWIICLVPVLLSIKLLAGTLKHMLAMSDQTIYADGLSRFGQVLPNIFFNLLPSEPIRLVIYLIFSFLIIISIVWLSFALFLKFSDRDRDENGKKRLKTPVEACLCISIAIIVLISISFTVVRMDVGSIYSRSEGVVFASSVILILLCFRYLKESSLGLVVFAFAVFLISVVSGEGVLKIGSSDKLNAYYTVPEGYLHVVEGGDLIEHWGNGFVETDFYLDMENANKAFMSLDKNESYMGALTYFGPYFLSDVKGVSVIETLTVKGYGAAKETTEILKQDKPIVGTGFSAFSSYYLYNWLVTSGYYIWDNESGAFIFNDGLMSEDDTKEYNKGSYADNDDYDLCNTSGSWGSSLKSLEYLFEQKDLNPLTASSGNKITLSFDEIDGNDADFLYIEFEDVDKEYQTVLYDIYDPIIKDPAQYGIFKCLLRKDYNPNTVVRVTWTDDNGKESSLRCNMHKGKLLIPLGSGYGWLLNRHSDITISVEKNGESLEIPEISEIKFLKIRSVE